ncbi:MAG: endopeptidase La [Myxococcales bacterium]|nr:endopeptidase La [Myxococcales bacterium]
MATEPMKIPTDPFPLLPLRGGVLLPGTVTTIPVGRRKSVELIRALARTGPPAIIGVGVQSDPRTSDPTREDIEPVATLAEVIAVNQAAASAYMVTLRGIGRFTIDAMPEREPYWRVAGTAVVDPTNDSDEARLLARALAEQIGALDAEAQGALGQLVKETDPDADPGVFADRVASLLDVSFDERVKLLGSTSAIDRLERVVALAGESLARGEVEEKIRTSVRKAFKDHQRESILRQQLKAIREELGEGDGDTDDLRGRLEAMELPEEVRKVVDRELGRLEGLQSGQAEYNVVRTYLETIADLPWNTRAPVNDDLDRVSAKLDADHYGLDTVKRRILEHMAVLKLSGNPRGTILCLAGPPGTGKTSLARSIADATGRPFVRIALGGVRDEAEVRGHRRTYVGALPGRLIQGLRKAGAKNPVMLLDELDKMSASSFTGSPEAAMLEVLDPEQNVVFTDHYLELPFDLSEVLFVCTANDIGKLSAPLRDRLEIVELEGYTYEEKVHIANQHLVPKQLQNHGVSADADESDKPSLGIDDETLRAIIRDYTREAGVRQLEREIIRLCRAAALSVARGQANRIDVGPGELGEYLGKPKYRSEVAERTALPGVATGLAWTPVGGDILFIETSKMPGKGGLEITGQLGDVMKESARAALTYVRSNAEMLGIDTDQLARLDLHIHVPAGAVPKDGPSAGVTIFTALTSLLTARQVRSDTAMTGECTLRGRVLPVGGIKAKVLAAHRAGLTRVILPQQNERDIDDVPEDVRDQIEFILADDMSEVLAAALESTAVDAPLGPGLHPIGGPSDGPQPMSARRR